MRATCGELESAHRGGRKGRNKGLPVCVHRDNWGRDRYSKLIWQGNYAKFKIIGVRCWVGVISCQKCYFLLAEVIERSRKCFLTQGWEPDCDSGGAG
jgi:hypothetical protein